jgi:protein-S-isoprenylcysteine O-methyltransferase Ste14
MKIDSGDVAQKNSEEHFDSESGQPDCLPSTKLPTFRYGAYLLVILTYVIGGVSMLVWLVFLFHGSLNIVNLGLSEAAGLGLNTCLCLAFFIQHSTMIRRSFRRWLAKFIEADYHGSLFTIASGVVLLILVVFWQKSAHLLTSPQGILRWLLHAVFFLSIVGFNWGTRALGSFDAFGLNPILNSLRGTESPPPMPFIVRGPYRWVRHPLYFFCLLMIWSCPDLSLDRLLHNVLWTTWIVVGSILEERDLVASFGEEYSNYKRKVPMLIPWRTPQAR